MPYPGEHSARLKDPKLYKRFRRENNKFKSGIHAIWGIRKDNDKVELQAIRFDKDKYTVEEAKKWLKDNDFKPILFEPASNKENEMEDDRIDLDEIDVKEMEHKSFEFNVTETKQQEKNGVPIGIIKGYASTFGNIDRFNDIISKGAFTKTIKDHRKSQRQVRMLHQHYRLALIGGFPPEFLEENDKGLFVEGHINLEVQAGKELYSLAKQGVLKDMSIGFTTKKSDTDEETGIRTLKEIKLWEISLVDEPANTQAQIVDVKADKKYSCECIECGYKIKTDKHCKDLKCSKCGGQMRRVGRPGPGQKDDDYDLETTIEDIYNGNVKTISDFLKHEKGLSNEEVKAVIVALKKLSKAQGKEYDSQKANLQVDNFLVNSLLNEIIKVQEKI